MPKPKAKAAPKKPSGKTILQRLIALIPDPGIAVTRGTRWKQDLGHDNDSLQIFCTGRVTSEFGRPFTRLDAGATVGDLEAKIKKVLAA